MNKIVLAFDHLLTKLALVGLKVHASKCTFGNPSKIPLGIKILHDYILVINGLFILGAPIGS
jgi:hypothetical protein